MIPTKALLNFSVFIILVIIPVRAIIVKYEEPFPSQLPVHIKSRVAFTQYANVPMLSLDEIKNGFPWLQVSAESVTDREEERSIKSGPRYVFYYVPTEVSHHSENPAKFYTDYQNPKSESESEKRNGFRDEKNDPGFHAKSNKSVQSLKEFTKKMKSNSKTKKLKEKLENFNTDNEPLQIEAQDLLEQNRRYERYRDRDIGNRKGGNLLSSPKNHKFRDGNLSVGSRFLNIAETRSMPNYLYPKIPSPYMQPPKLKFEEKEFWIKNKRKSKRPFEDSTTNEERLKNHRIVKHKKSKKPNPDDEKHLKNHKPSYDREHDPEERAESSNGKEKRLHKRPKEKLKENPKNALSQDGERIDFQIHGHEGPQSYIFGYDTGNGENRHFRLEERLRDGSVKGHYGYYDSNGKLKMVEYRAKPMGGYEEKHHASDTFKSDQVNDDEIPS